MGAATSTSYRCIISVLIQVQAFAIRSEKSPIIHAAGQIAIPAFLQAFEIMQTYARICSYLSERNISFFAFYFKIRCKRSHGKIRVVQKGYYFDQKKGCFFFGSTTFYLETCFLSITCRHLQAFLDSCSRFQIVTSYPTIYLESGVSETRRIRNARI